MASYEKSNVLIVGATGAIGRYITEKLIDAKASFGRLGILTRPVTAEKKSGELQKLKEQGVEVQLAEWDDEDGVLKAFEGYDTVVSALGRDALALQIPLLRLADQSPHIKRFIPSEYGTDIEHSPSSAHEPTHQQKLKIRKAIREEATDLQGFFLVTGPYVEMWLGTPLSDTDRSGGWDVKAKKAVVSNPDGEIGFTTMGDVGRYLVAALLHPEVNTGKGYRALIVNSFTTTPAKALAEFERQTRAKWEVTVVPLEELRASEKQLWDEKKPLATRVTLRRIWAEGGTLYDKTDNDELNIGNPQTLEWAVNEAIKAQEAGKGSSA